MLMTTSPSDVRRRGARGARRPPRAPPPWGLGAGWARRRPSRSAEEPPKGLARPAGGSAEGGGGGAAAKPPARPAFPATAKDRSVSDERRSRCGTTPSNRSHGFSFAKVERRGGYIAPPGTQNSHHALVGRDAVRRGLAGEGALSILCVAVVQAADRVALAWKREQTGVAIVPVVAGAGAGAGGALRRNGGRCICLEQVAGIGGPAQSLDRARGRAEDTEAPPSHTRRIARRVLSDGRCRIAGRVAAVRGRRHRGRTPCSCCLHTRRSAGATSVGQGTPRMHAWSVLQG